MKERRQLICLNLALILLWSLLPMPVFAAEGGASEEPVFQQAFDAAGETLRVGGRTVGYGEKAEGPGWSYNGVTTLTLKSGYTGEAVSTTLTALTIQVEGSVSAAGVSSTGRVDFNLTDPACRVSITGAEGQSAVTANMLVFGSEPKGALRIQSGGAGVPALSCATLMLPTARGYDEQSTNVILRSGTSEETARPVTEYDGQEYVYWELTECEVLFLSDGTVAERQNLPLGREADVRMAGAPEKSGGIFLGWSNGGKVYQPGQAASIRLSRTKEVFEAVWAERPETGVVYHGNGGTVAAAGSGKVAVTTVSAAPGTAVDLTSQGFSTGYYSFEGWSLTPGGEPLKSFTVPEGSAADLYAVWKSSNTIPGTSAGKRVSLVPGVVSLGDEAVDASLSPYQESSGTGWSGKAADLTLTAEYSGAPIETAFDLNLHISGQVRVNAASGAAIRAGGTLYLDFAPGASLRVTGSAGAPAIDAGNLWVGMPGALYAVGGSGASALEAAGTMNLSNPGADKSGYQNRLYSGGEAVASYEGQQEIEIRRPAAEFTFHFQDGATADGILETEYDGRALFNAPEPVWEGHAFLGWSADAGGLSEAYYTKGGAAPDFSGGRDLYAIWGDDFGGRFVILDGRGRSVTADGRGACTVALADDGAALLPETADWTGQAEYALPASGVVTDLLWGGQRHVLVPGQRLYAVWGTEPYYTFLGNGGITSSGGAVAKAATPDKMEGVAFAREGQTLGWWTEFPDGTGRAYAPGSEYDKTLKTYYAHWVDGRAVCWGGGGTLSGGAVARETDSLPADANGFIRPGHQFLGWALQRGGSAATQAEFDAALSAGGPVYLYALWSAVTVRLHNATNCSELKPNADGTYTLPYGRSRSFYTDAFDGWNTKPDGSGTWYPYGTVIDPAQESAAEFYAFFVDSTQPSVWMTAGRGGFDGKTFQTVSETLPAGFTLPAQVGERQILAWWFGSFYTDGGAYPRGAVAPGDMVENWTLRTCFRAVDDGENTDEHARTVQDLNGGVTADGFRLMVSYASLGDLRLAGSDMVFREGYTLREWNTSADGTGQSYLPGARIYNHAGLSKAPRQVFAIWEPTSAPFATVTTVAEGQRVQTPVALGARITLPTPERNDGLGFVGWNTEAAGTGQTLDGTITVNGAVTLYAQWADPALTVTVPEMMRLEGAAVYLALYDGDGAMLTLQKAVGGKAELYALPEVAARWKLFCLNEDGRPLTKPMEELLP